MTTQLKRQKKPFRVHDWTAKNNVGKFKNTHWDYSTYEIAGVPWGARYHHNTNLLGRAVSQESKQIFRELEPGCPAAFGENCCVSDEDTPMPVFVHETPEKKLLPEILNMFLDGERFFQVRPWETNSILSWVPVIERCPIVVCVDSSFANLVEGLRFSSSKPHGCDTFICQGCKTPPPMLTPSARLYLTDWKPPGGRGSYEVARAKAFQEAFFAGRMDMGVDPFNEWRKRGIL